MKSLNRTFAQSIRLVALPLVAIAASVSVSAQQAFFFPINAAQEVPPNASTASGVALMTLNTTTGALTYNISYSGLSSAESAAHIHGFAAPGSNAGVQLVLPAGNPKVGSAVLTPAQVTGMMSELTYVNIHTAMNPGGEIRGQILKASSPMYLTTAISGLQEVPPSPSPATGNGCFSFDPFTSTLSYNIAFSVGTLLGPETAAHIHGFAAPGSNAGVLFVLPAGSPKVGVAILSPAQALGMLNQLTYVNIHTAVFAGGEIRGQILRGTAPAPVLYCAGDGTGTPCPCGNNSAAGLNAGCLNSFATAGTVRARGLASLNCDSLVLDGAGMSPTTSALFFQGTARVAAGAGSLFGDGLRCAGGAVVRLGTIMTAAGAASYPTGALLPISVKGLITAPGLRTYQVWYRNSAAFCSPDGFNLTGAVEVTWVP